MIANDIVDIEEANKTQNWEKPRFLDVLFTSEEQQLIHNSDSPKIMTWRLWSMKEAAYKLYTQLHPSRFYSPNQFKCEINGDTGKVYYNNFVCFLNSKISQRFIFSEAKLSVGPVISNRLIFNCSDQNLHSIITKEALLSYISKELQILKSELIIIKSSYGIPYVYHKTKKLNLSISITHHGKHGAYVISRQ